jgi:predicted nucleic acid-binding protein
MKVYFDTNVLVAALKREHSDHIVSFAAYQSVRGGRIEGVISGQVLAEIYSVMTRTPFRPPVYPHEAGELIEHSIMPYFTVVDAAAATYRAAIAACAKSGWKGGRVHDAVHIQAAMQAKCDLIYTNDVAHFRSLAPEWTDRIRRP